MRHASTSTMWLLAAALLGLAALVQIAAADQVALGIAFLGIGAMFFIFAMTTGRTRDADD